MSQEYIGAIVIAIISALKMFGIEIGSDAVNGIVVGVIALWVAIRRHGKGDITIAGFKR